MEQLLHVENIAYQSSTYELLQVIVASMFLQCMGFGILYLCTSNSCVNVFMFLQCMGSYTSAQLYQCFYSAPGHKCPKFQAPVTFVLFETRKL